MTEEETSQAGTDTGHARADGDLDPLRGLAAFEDLLAAPDRKSGPADEGEGR